MEAINNLVNNGVVTDVLFYAFAALTLFCGILVVANPFSRNPVTSAMFLVLTIISMSGLFVLLHAFFLAAVQIIVYAGAVLVLFVFVIMLLDLKEEQRRKIKMIGFILGLIAVGGIVSALMKSLPADNSGPGKLTQEGGTVELLAVPDVEVDAVEVVELVPVEVTVISKAGSAAVVVPLEALI